MSYIPPCAGSGSVSAAAGQFQPYTDNSLSSYGAPAAPVYSPTPSSYSAPAPGQVPDYDYYKHEHHHFYHAGPPKVVHVKVPVTQKPYGNPGRC